MFKYSMQSIAMIPLLLTRKQKLIGCFFLFQFICVRRHVVSGSWVPLNPRSEVSLTVLAKESRRIELGNNGRRMAVGLANNSIVVYDLVPASAHDDRNLIKWAFAAQLEHVDSAYFSLSSDGQFLASRHESITNKVEAWKIKNTVSIDEDSAKQKTEFSSAAIDESKQKGKTKNIENIGSFWCAADVQSVKLGQSGTNLYLAMGCETWSSSRGMVQVFVRTFSLAGNSNSVWENYLPSLKGRNDGDLFGAALSITVAPSHGSGYELRIAVGSPGYNNGQGLVLIYTFSRSTSSGWAQMGDDLTGSQVGERFGAALDMSDNNKHQPFLVVGSPGWKEATDNMKDDLSDDSSSDEASLRCKGTGIVRLYHWRKPASSFRAPRRWMLVGNPMSGLHKGDQFGSNVVMARTGERIAIAALPIEGSYENCNDHRYQGGYIGVYERESFHTWGKIVNGIISYDEVFCAESKQCLAMNDQGSMVVTSLTDGSVGAFIDDSPFCDIFPEETPLVNDKKSIQSRLLNFENLLDRHTCRNRDSLIESSTSCSEQSVYMKGEFRNCLWQDVPITYSPSIVQSEAPSSALIPIHVPVPAPSTGPSFIPSISEIQHISNKPSMSPHGFSSSEPLVVTKFPTVAFSPFPTESHTRDPSVSSTLPSTNDDVENLSSISLLPTPMMAGTPSEIPTSHVPSSSVKIDWSISPTIQALDKSDVDNELFILNSCQCDAFGVCIDRALIEAHPLLRICVFVKMDNYEDIEVSLGDVKILHDDLSHSVIDSGSLVQDKAKKTEYICQHFSQIAWRVCTLESFVWFLFSERNHTSSVVVEGNASVVYFNGVSMNRRSDSFSVPVRLGARNIHPMTSAKTSDASDRKTATRLDEGKFAALIMIPTILAFRGWF